ncbi:hypothetical protein O3M35_008376 [Rhynocoris fuscipes]|uniref:Apolipoprotein D n=1 Tax=Rhynocoris fuscipes TaxID=488301 RepID=A0AAW1D601_9HEMI
MSNHIIYSAFLLLCSIIFVQSDINCPKLSEPSDFNSKQYFGTWYAVRGIEHSNNLKEKAKRNKTCPKVTVSDKKNNVWEFEWTTNDTKRFRLKEDPQIPGRLTKVVKGETIGMMQITTIPGINNIWAVTICKPDRIASAILSSTPIFKKELIEKLTTILNNQGLKTDYVYDRCD